MLHLINIFWRSLWFKTIKSTPPPTLTPLKSTIWGGKQKQRVSVQCIYFVYNFPEQQKNSGCQGDSKGKVPCHSSPFVWKEECQAQVEKTKPISSPSVFLSLCLALRAAIFESNPEAWAASQDSAPASSGPQPARPSWKCPRRLKYHTASLDENSNLLPISSKMSSILNFPGNSFPSIPSSPFYNTVTVFPLLWEGTLRNKGDSFTE